MCDSSFCLLLILSVEFVFTDSIFTTFVACPYGFLSIDIRWNMYLYCFLKITAHLHRSHNMLWLSVFVAVHIVCIRVQLLNKVNTGMWKPLRFRMGWRFVACDPSSALLLSPQAVQQMLCAWKAFGESPIKQKTSTEVEVLRFRMGLNQRPPD